MYVLYVIFITHVLYVMKNIMYKTFSYKIPIPLCQRIMD